MVLHICISGLLAVGEDIVEVEHISLFLQEQFYGPAVPRS